MSDPLVRYVTLAYGDAPGVYRQSLMLLVSLVAHAPDPYELVVATDRPERYVWFGTRVEIEYVRSVAAGSMEGIRPVFDAPEARASSSPPWPDRRPRRPAGCRRARAAQSDTVRDGPCRRPACSCTSANTSSAAHGAWATGGCGTRYVTAPSARGQSTATMRCGTPAWSASARQIAR